MDKLRVLSPSNGFPFNWDDLDFAFGLGSYSDGVIQAIEGVLKSKGDDLIVSGCEVSGSNIAEGWVLIGGTLVKVDAHTATNSYFEIVTTYNANGNKQTQLGGTEDSYQQNRATATAASGTLESPVTGNPSYFGGILTKKLNIGGWDMFTDNTVTLNHELDFDKIIGIRSIMITRDDNAFKLPFYSDTAPNVGQFISITTTQIIIGRYPGELWKFNSTDYNDPVTNRGYILIDHLP